MKHAKLSPSSSHRWLACPGSVRANAEKPRTHNIHSLTGTTAHGLLEVCLRLGDEPVNYIGMILEEDHLPIDQEMADAVGYALDYVRAYVADNPKTKVLIEHTVYMDASLGLDETDKEDPEDPDEHVCFGTGDIILDNFPKECVNVDYKHGVGIVVSVKGNSQLRLYAVGQRQGRGRYHRYRQVVIQPRVRGRKPVQEHSVTDKELTDWVNKVVIPVVPVALATKSPRVAGDHCHYCHADGNCDAQYADVQRRAKEDFKAKDPHKLTPREMATMLDSGKAIEKIVEAVKLKAIAAAHAGVEIPGWQADFTAARRMWVDEKKAAALLGKLGLSPEERIVTSVLAPAPAEKALRAKKKWPKKVRGEELANPFEEVLGYTDTKPTISKVAPE